MAKVSRREVLRMGAALYYSVDGSAFEYELYENDADPDQMVNLLSGPLPPERSQWQALHAQLGGLMAAKRALPEGFDWALAQPPTADI